MKKEEKNNLNSRSKLINTPERNDDVAIETENKDIDVDNKGEDTKISIEVLGKNTEQVNLEHDCENKDSDTEKKETDADYDINGLDEKDDNWEKPSTTTVSIYSQAQSPRTKASSTINLANLSKINDLLQSGRTIYLKDFPRQSLGIGTKLFQAGIWFSIPTVEVFMFRRSTVQELTCFDRAEEPKQNSSVAGVDTELAKPPENDLKENQTTSAPCLLVDESKTPEKEDSREKPNSSSILGPEKYLDDLVDIDPGSSETTPISLPLSRLPDITPLIQSTPVQEEEEEEEEDNENYENQTGFIRLPLSKVRPLIPVIGDAGIANELHLNKLRPPDKDTETSFIYQPRDECGPYQVVPSFVHTIPVIPHGSSLAISSKPIINDWNIWVCWLVY